MNNQRQKLQTTIKIQHESEEARREFEEKLDKALLDNKYRFRSSFFLEVSQMLINGQLSNK